MALARDGFTFQHPRPPGVQPTPGFENQRPNLDSSRHGSQSSSGINPNSITQQPRQAEENSLEPAEPDHVVAQSSDSGNHDALLLEIQKLASRIEAIEMKDKITTEILGLF